MGNWLYLDNKIQIKVNILIDFVSIAYSFLTISIAVFVFCFSFVYLRYEPIIERFLILLNLFVLSMVFLVLSGNLICLFLGWELIGLTSYFLINF
ncbi:MAG: hypothetical protein KGZ59_10190 [Chitinophagaceae bacterium]|nr:hypothetical protein [Chitinophagaceae bacterium]